MNELTRNNCEQLIANRGRVRSVFTWDGGWIHLCCAGIYSVRGLSGDEAVLRASEDLTAEKVGVFSCFRSTVRAPIAALLIVSGNPEQRLENGLNIYNLLK